MKTPIISESRKELLRVLLKDDNLNSVLLMNGEVARNIKIKDDGSIEIGRTKAHWWNLFFNDIRRMTFIEVAFALAKVMAGNKANSNEVIFKGLSNEIIENAIQRDDLDYVVDALFATAMFGFDGKYKSRYLNINDNSTRKSGDRETRKGKVPFILNSGQYLGDIDVAFIQR